MSCSETSSSTRRVLPRRLAAALTAWLLLLAVAGVASFYLLRGLGHALDATQPTPEHTRPLRDAEPQELELMAGLLGLNLLGGGLVLFLLRHCFKDHRKQLQGEAAARRLARDKALLEAAQDLAFAPRHEQALLQAFCELLIRFGHAQIAHVALLQGRHLEAVAGASLPPFSPAPRDLLRVNGSPASEALMAGLRRGEPQLVRNDAVAMGTSFGWPCRLGLVSALALPLRQTGGVSAALVLFHGESEAHTGDRLPLLQRVAEQLSQALLVQQALGEEAAESTEHPWQTPWQTETL